jgi:hypothetical protein
MFSLYCTDRQTSNRTQDSPAEPVGELETKGQMRGKDKTEGKEDLMRFKVPTRYHRRPATR